MGQNWRSHGKGHPELDSMRCDRNTNEPRMRPSRRGWPIAALMGALSLVALPASTAFASSTYEYPKITASSATFSIPSTSTPSTVWRLRLWSHGTLEGATTGSAGVLRVAVPNTPGCDFQADVTAKPQGRAWFYYSGVRVSLGQCGPPSQGQTLAGHIYSCSGNGSPTINEVPDGSLKAVGAQTSLTQSNPLLVPALPSGVYVVSAEAPQGYLFVACGGAVSIGSGSTTAAESVAIPTGGSGEALFYVTAIASAAGGGSPVASSPGLAVSSSPASAPHGSGPAVGDAVPVDSAQLALTGLNVGPLLQVALAMMAFGLLLEIRSRKSRPSRPASQTPSPVLS
jgi:hypothetical protein